MFKLLDTPTRPMLINFDLVTKIVPRPKNGNRENSIWEVAMFHIDERRLHPKTGESVWVGTYEVIFEGLESECLKYVENLEKDLQP